MSSRAPRLVATPVHPRFCAPFFAGEIHPSLCVTERSTPPERTQLVTVADERVELAAIKLVF
jgi:hypothetical protein